MIDSKIPTTQLTSEEISIIGLDNVSLPLAMKFGKQRPAPEFDLNTAREAKLQTEQDHAREMSPAEPKKPIHLRFSANSVDLQACTISIVTAPTPVDHANKTNLTPPVEASGDTESVYIIQAEKAVLNNGVKQGKAPALRNSMAAHRIVAHLDVCLAD